MNNPRVKTFLNQAWPIFVSSVIVTLYGIIDMIFLGHKSPKELAVVAVGTNLFNTAYICIMGMLLILLPYVSRFHGAKNPSAVSQVIRKGIMMALLFSIPICLLLLFPGTLLSLSRLSSEQEVVVRKFLRVLAASVPALLLFRVFFAYVGGTVRSKLIMKINIVGLLVKVPMSYIAIFGFGIIQPQGAVGAATTTGIVSWLLIIAAAVIMYNDRIYGGYLVFKKSYAGPSITYKELIRHGAPIGLTFFVDYTSITLIGLFAARTGVADTGANQIAASISYFTYLVPMALANSASVLVANALGAGHIDEARKIGLVSLKLGCLMSLVISIVLIFGRKEIALLYTANGAIAESAAGLLLFVAIYHFFDAFVTLSNGILRAYKKTIVPTLILGSTLWVIGTFGGYTLAFSSHFGVLGFWIALSVAAIVAAVSVGFYYAQIIKSPRKGTDESATLHDQKSFA